MADAAHVERRGGYSAVEAFVHDHVRAAYLFALYSLGHRDEAQDIVQDAFIRVLQNKRPRGTRTWRAVRDEVTDACVRSLRRAGRFEAIPHMAGLLDDLDASNGPFRDAPVPDWDRLEREMSGNIAVGIAAARCISHVRKRNYDLLVTLCAISLLGMIGAAWMFRDILSQPLRWFAAPATEGFSRGRAGANAIKIYAGPVAALHPANSSLGVNGNTATAEYFEAAQNLVVSESVTLIPAESTMPRVAFRLPAAAPIAIESMDVQPRPDGFVHGEVVLVNKSAKPISAALFRGAGVALAFLDANISPNAPVTLSIDLHAPATLSLDSVEFSDGSHWGEEWPEWQTARANDSDIRSEIGNLIRNHDWPGVRRALRFGAENAIAKEVSPPELVRLESIYRTRGTEAVRADLTARISGTAAQE